jgi:hypothetical protein
MSNSELDDIAVLTTLQQLWQQNMLAAADRKTLEARLSSDWGRGAAQKLFLGSLNGSAEHNVLKLFSASF